MMFSAGANSIFSGDKLLTAANNEVDDDKVLFEKLGFVGKPAHQGPRVGGWEMDGTVKVERTEKAAVKVEHVGAAM
jgi:hypothetical protein